MGKNARRPNIGYSIADVTLQETKSRRGPKINKQFQGFGLKCSKKHSSSVINDSLPTVELYYPSDPHLEVFEETDVEVIKAESDGEKVVLKEVDLSASGSYKCEVNLDWPEFKSVFEISNMTVVVIPQEQPNIEGDIGGHYKVGDRVRLNCTAAPSIPPAALVWLINDKPHASLLQIHSNFSVKLIKSPDDLKQSYPNRFFADKTIEVKIHSPRRGPMQLRENSKAELNCMTSLDFIAHLMSQWNCYSTSHAYTIMNKIFVSV
ncbi:hypothetical protein SK128_022443 [Halocaridina rubra]|uniref:Ig-like domain-containing protein n=1 Tax=Halocaridina rubra TaxID=373956 RepID=A0AAN8WV20_HALRR